MAGIDLNTFRQAFTDEDGTLPDCEVVGSRPGDWKSVFDAVAARGWRSARMTDEGETALPTDLNEVPAQPNLIAVWPSPSLRINFFPAHESVIFDFDVREIIDQPALDVLTDLIRTIARTACKPVTISYEGGGVAFHYDVENDTFHVPS